MVALSDGAGDDELDGGNFVAQENFQAVFEGVAERVIKGNHYSSWRALWIACGGVAQSHDRIIGGAQGGQLPVKLLGCGVEKRIFRARRRFGDFVISENGGPLPHEFLLGAAQENFL